MGFPGQVHAFRLFSHMARPVVQALFLVALGRHSHKSKYMCPVAHWSSMLSSTYGLSMSTEDLGRESFGRCTAIPIFLFPAS